MEKEKDDRYAWELVDIDKVVWVDVGEVHNSWYEDIDLEPLETGLVAVGAPVQDVPVISGVPRPHGIEAVVFLAKSSLDGFRATPVRGEAKDVKVLDTNSWLACEWMRVSRQRRTFGWRPLPKVYSLHAIPPIKQQSSIPIALRVSMTVSAISNISQ